jgi:hypothetical protein
MVTPVLRGSGDVGTEEVVHASILGGFLTIFIGGFIGLFHYSRIRGVAWGVVIGGLVGIACGPIGYAPPDELSFVFSTAVGGSLLVVCIAAAIRLNSSDGFVEDACTNSSDGIVTAVVVCPKRHPLDPDPEDEC